MRAYRLHYCCWRYYYTYRLQSRLLKVLSWSICSSVAVDGYVYMPSCIELLPYQLPYSYWLLSCICSPSPLPRDKLGREGLCVFCQLSRQEAQVVFCFFQGVFRPFLLCSFRLLYSIKHAPEVLSSLRHAMPVRTLFAGCLDIAQVRAPGWVDQLLPLLPRHE